MRIINTSKMDDIAVRTISTFAAKGINTTGILLTVAHTKSTYHGVAYNRAPNGAPAGVRYEVNCFIGEPCNFPTNNMHRFSKWLKPGLTQEEAEAIAATYPEGELDGTTNCWGDYCRTWYRVLYQHPYGGRRSPFITYNTREEALCGLVAHELRHVVQFRNFKRLSEVDCERWASKRLEAYRQEFGTHG